MLNLRKKIKELQENTSSLEAKQVCKEIMENFVNITDSQLSASLVEKLSKIDDADKHVKKFITITEKISNVTNLGVAKCLSELGILRREIRESAVFNYPALTYNLNNIENMLTNKGMPEYMVIDQMIECLKPFTWEPALNDVHKLLKENRELHDELVTVAKNIYILNGMKGSFMYEGILAKLEEHFINPTQSSRGALIEDLKRLNFTPEVRSLSESLKKLQGKNGSVQIIAENSRCEVSSVFSPVTLHEGNEILFVRGNFYSKKDDKVTKLVEFNALPESYTELCRIVSSPNVFIKEGKVSFFLKRNKVEISENENKVDVYFNGSKVPSGDLAKHMVSAGMFRLDEAQAAYDVQKISESFKHIYELDFAKIIESKVYQGSYVILMKTGANISITKVNESGKTNEFYSNLNTTQARNLVLEFIGYDIKESMEEYSSDDDKKLKELREAKIKIAESIAIVESQISKLAAVENEPALRDSSEVKELKSVLENEISKLKNQYRKVAADIKLFETGTSDLGYEVGDEIKINETGDIATVISINSVRNTVTVVNAAGRTNELDTTKISSLESQLTKNEETNATAATTDTDKKKA